LYLLDQSLASELSYKKFQAIVANPLAKLVLLGLIWSFLHHFFAGIRYLLLDREIGIDKVPANRSAIGVLIISLSLTLILGAKLFGFL
jgi:succinate dehydrogenase / fumarate reductase cytochrome b subunit